MRDEVGRCIKYIVLPCLLFAAAPVTSIQTYLFQTSKPLLLYRLSLKPQSLTIIPQANSNTALCLHSPDRLTRLQNEERSKPANTLGAYRSIKKPWHQPSSPTTIPPRKPQTSANSPSSSQSKAPRDTKVRPATSSLNLLPPKTKTPSFSNQLVNTE